MFSPLGGHPGGMYVCVHMLTSVQGKRKTYDMYGILRYPQMSLRATLHFRLVRAVEFECRILRDFSDTTRGMVGITVLPRNDPRL